MYEKKNKEDIRCPLEYGLEIFGGKWNSRVICVLAAFGSLRYSEIRREMVNITDNILGLTLKGLLKNGLIERKAYNEIPPKVEYFLTEKGKSIVPILQKICEWSAAWNQTLQNSDSDMPQLKHCQKCGKNPNPSNNKI